MIHAVEPQTKLSPRRRKCGMQRETWSNLKPQWIEASIGIYLSECYRD